MMILRVFEIDDGEKHVVAAKDKDDAITCACEGLGMDGAGDPEFFEDAKVRELPIDEMVEVRYDSLEDLRRLFNNEEIPMPKSIAIHGKPEDVIKGKHAPEVLATFQVIMLTHSKRGLVSSTVY